MGIGDFYIVPGGEVVAAKRRHRTGVSEGYTQFDQEMDNRFTINNCVIPSTSLSPDSIWCKICHQKCVTMTKAGLLNIGLSDIFNDKVEKECVDGKLYLFCKTCCQVHGEEPESQIMPVDMGRVMCVKCQYTITHGKQKTLTPKLMHENIEDENKPIRLGEPTSTSPKRWFWACSACNYREPMLPSNLKRTYKPNSFVQSFETRKGPKKPWELSDEDKRDLGLFGYDSRGAYLVDESETPGY